VGGWVVGVRVHVNERGKERLEGREERGGERARPPRTVASVQASQPGKLKQRTLSASCTSVAMRAPRTEFWLKRTWGYSLRVTQSETSLCTTSSITPLSGRVLKSAGRQRGMSRWKAEASVARKFMLISLNVLTRWRKVGLDPSRVIRESLT
jgi:hypothetical protein